MKPMLMEETMTAYINYHPHPTRYAGSRVLSAAAVAAALIVVALIVGMSSTAPGTTSWQEAGMTPTFVLPIDPTFMP
jgi:hypothetical protein